MKSIDQIYWHDTCTIPIIIISCPAATKVVPRRSPSLSPSPCHHRDPTPQPGSSSCQLPLDVLCNTMITIVMVWGRHCSNDHTFLSCPTVRPVPPSVLMSHQLLSPASYWRIILMSLQHSPRSWLMVASLLITIFPSDRGRLAAAPESWLADLEMHSSMSIDANIWHVDK